MCIQSAAKPLFRCNNLLGVPLFANSIAISQIRMDLIHQDIQLLFQDVSVSDESDFDARKLDEVELSPCALSHNSPEREVFTIFHQLM